MNTEQQTNSIAPGGSELPRLLDLINYFEKEQERLWQYVKECAIRNVIPKELPLDAVLFVSSHRFDNLHHLFKMEFAGRVFADRLLQYDTIVIMKRPTAKLSRAG